MEKVQFWKGGVMLGLISREEAETMVKEGKAKWITSQAIEWWEDIVNTVQGKTVKRRGRRRL